MTYLLLLGLVLFAVVTFGYLFSKRFHADVDAAEQSAFDEFEAYIQASQKAK